MCAFSGMTIFAEYIFDNLLRERGLKVPDQIALWFLAVVHERE
jgi:hypothetical protein